MTVRIATVIAALALLVVPGSALAEKMPKPSIDFAVEGTMDLGNRTNPGTMRHSHGKMRFDAQVEGEVVSIYIDLVARTAIVVAVRQGQKLALHVDPENAGDAAGFLDRDAKRMGSDRIAGEDCVEYEFENAKKRQMRACVTSDGIALRTRDLSRDRVVWEVIRVLRTPQAPEVFVVPADAVPVHIPKMQ